jgi:hypothetical protein
VRWGFARAVRQVLESIVAAGQPLPRAAYVPPPSTLPALSGPSAVDSEAARERARAVLEEARAEMPSLLRDAPLPVPELTHVPAEAAGLRQALRSYTDHVDRLLTAADEERRVLRDQVNRLSEELLMLRAEVTGLRALIPPAPPSLLHQPVEVVPNVVPPAPAGPIPTAPLPSSAVAVESRSPGTDTREQHGEADVASPLPTLVPANDAEAPMPSADATLSETPPLPAAPDSATQPTGGEAPAPAPVAQPGAEELARLDARVFPAGTIGLLMGLAPVDDFHRLTMIQERLGNEAGVESVELSSYELGEARLRLTFRTPARGRWLRETIERAAGAPIDPTTIRFEQGMVHARFTRDV